MSRDTETKVKWLRDCISCLESEIVEWESKKFFTAYRSVVKLCEDEIFERQQQIEDMKKDMKALEGSYED